MPPSPIPRALALAIASVVTALLVVLYFDAGLLSANTSLSTATNKTSKDDHPIYAERTPEWKKKGTVPLSSVASNVSPAVFNDDVVTSASSNQATSIQKDMHAEDNIGFFIFGHSTGHSGSTTVHNALIQPGCPWDNSLLVEHFENEHPGERIWPHDVDCSLTETTLVPFLQSTMESKKQELMIAASEDDTDQ